MAGTYGFLVTETEPEPDLVLSASFEGSGPSLTRAKIVIYVDAANGSDSNNGAIDNPYKTLAKALEDINSNGLIILQAGSYSVGSYGTISKNVRIQAAYGAEPEITDEIRYVNAQGHIQGIKFETGSIYVDNANFGGFSIKNCNFNGKDKPIVIDSASYVSLHQNRFFDYTEALRVSFCREMTISSNYFYSSTSANGRAIFVTDVEWLDIYQNTIYGAYDLGGVAAAEDVNLRIIYISMNPTIIDRKSVSLPSFAYANDYGYDVAVNVVNGPTQEYGKDYTVINSGVTLSWDNLGLQGQLQDNDIIRVMYSEGSSPVSGDAISAYNVGNSNSRIDSNNINDADIGIVFTDDLRVRYNNFHGLSSFYSGVTSDESGNITGAPGYVSPLTGDFHLQPNSPNINYSDLERWSTLLQEMGIGNISGHYTVISLPTGRPGIAPFNRSVDYDGLRRLSRSDRNDIGSYEFPSTGINPETMSYIAEDGFDLINPGSITGPFATIDRGFSGTKDLQVQVNPLGSLILNPDGTHVGITGINQGLTGYSYGRYYSDNTDMRALSLSVGNDNRKNVAFFYSSYPSNTSNAAYVGPPISDRSGATGSTNNPYRTIDEAISESPAATTIYVKPGLYPAFDAAANKKLIGIPQSSYVSLDGTQYLSFDEAGWTGSAAAVFETSSLSFNGDGSAYTVFEMQGNIYVRMNWTVISDTMEIKLFNDTNHILINKTGNILKTQHMTDGVSYSASTVSLDNSYRVTLRVDGYLATIAIKGSSTNIDRQVELVSGYEDPWMLSVTYTDSAVAGSTGYVESFKSRSERFLFPGDTGISSVGLTGTSMSRKVFGIIGERGLSGLYSLYGV